MGDDDDNDQDDSESVGANTPDLIVSTVTTDIPSPDGEGGMSVTVKITTKPRKARAKVDPVPLTAEELEAQQRERDAKAEIRAAAKLGITVDELRDRRAEEYVEHSRRIAEQVAIDRVGLAPHHVADWKKFWPDVQTPEGFLEMVCNRQTVLNQKRQGDLVHFPCHTLHDNPFQDVQEGWRTDRPYLLILPSPAVEDVAGNWRLSSHDPVSSFLRNELTSLGIPLEECMVTYACRFPLPVGTKTYNSGHQTACSPYVRADALACRPQVIVAFGAVALKALLGQKTKLDTHRGDVETWEGIPVIPTQSPLQFMAGWGTIEVFRDELQRALEIRQGVYRRDAIDRSGHRVIRTVQEMRELVDTIEAAAPRHIAFDFEFGSLVKRKEALLCRSLQISWAAGQAAFIVLRGDNGAHVHSMEDYDEMWRLSHRILADPRWRLDGHHVRVDAQRMWEAGYSIDDKVETAFDTMLVHHLLHGDDDQGLDQLVRKYLPWMGAYWKDLELWLDANGRTRQLEFGYLTVPEPILIPYGLIDADATWRCAEMLEVELKAEPRLWDLYWQITAPANLHIMDVERQGITVDDAQRMRLRDIIKPEFEAIVREFREIAKWKDFDPAKAWQIAEYLYSGTAFKGKKGQKKHEGDETGKVPHTAILLDLPPPFNTDKYPLQWEDIEAKGENHLHSPSTKSAAIELLIAQHPEIEELRYLKFMSVLGKYLNTYLTPIAIDPETNLPAEGKSFSANIGDDGKVRGTIHQISETGRWRMTGPNLQCCVTGDHEVLTPQGWVRFDALADGVEVMQWAQDGALSFAMPEVTRTTHTGQMIRIKGQHISKVVTPTHRIPHFVRDTNEFRVLTAEQLLVRARDVLIPSAGTYDGPGVTMPDALLRLVVATQADGHYKHDDRGVDFGFRKKRKYDRLIELLNEAGIPFRDYTNVHREGWTRYRVYVKDDQLFSACDAILGSAKTFDFEAVFRLSQHQVQLVVDEIMLWDGCSTRKTQYSSTREINVDVIQALSTGANRRSSKGALPARDGSKGGWRGKPLYLAYLASPGRNYTGLASVEYGWMGAPADVTPVYCVTVPTGFFVIRHNNKVCVTGNSPKKQESAVLEAFVYRRFGGMPLSEYQRRTNDKKPPPDLIPKDQRIDLPSFKSVYVAGPGNCFIEVDYKTAELCLWAYCSGDQALSKIIEQGRDLHCETAASCFKLPEAETLVTALEAMEAGDDKPYKAWARDCKSVRENLRSVAKCIIFGVIYGRGASALSREINKQGVPTDPDQCQLVIDGIAKKFPVAWAWLLEAQKQAVEQGYAENCYGFKRYFTGLSQLGRTEQAKAKRQAPNSRVQGGVAMQLCVAGINFYRFRYRTTVGRQIGFQNILPIHDAYLIEFPEQHFKTMQRVIRVCMSEANPIPGTNGKVLGVDMNGTPAHRWSDH